MWAKPDSAIMFKTAQFKVHNPSRHKSAMLRFAMGQYHRTLKRVLEAALSDPNLEAKISRTDAKGKQRPNRYLASKLLYTLAPKQWALAPLRDYLIQDAASMLMSHFGKRARAKNPSNPPTVPALVPPSQSQIHAATREFTQTVEFPLKPQQLERIQKELKANRTRVAARLSNIYKSWAATRAAGAMLRTLEAPLPRPIEFTRPEFGRGYLLARKGNRFYFLVRLFARNHRYGKPVVLDHGFLNWRTREVIAGKRYPGLILPLELGREYHEKEFIEQGRPQSAKLVMKRAAGGRLEFYAHIAFEFTPEPVATRAFLGLDRGAAMIAAATLINAEGRPVPVALDLEGKTFQREMALYRKRIAEAQRRGHRHARIFRVRGRRADILIGEYANRVVRAAFEHRAQIVLEKIDAVAMGRFLSQSQFRKLHATLAYKAERLGLPRPVEVPAARTSQTCSRCGHWAPENRPKRDEQGRAVQDIFRCRSCGFQANADQNASHIIALRGLHQALKGGKFQRFAEFQQWLKEHCTSLGRDGTGPGHPVPGQ